MMTKMPEGSKALEQRKRDCLTERFCFSHRVHSPLAVVSLHVDICQYIR